MKTIVIIGGGWSGTFTAIQLLEMSKTVRVKIIHSGPPLGLGVAYNTNESEHLLNVPAGRMSAFKNKPNHFSDWLISKGYSTNPTNEYVPRKEYGNYLLELVEKYQSNQHLEVIDARAIDIQKSEKNYEILLNTNHSVAADKIVLALGNFLPASPKLKSPSFYKSNHYFQNPWTSDYLNNLAADKNILLIGTGLTMVDCILSLKKIGFKKTIYVVSPRGYTPFPHGTPETYPDFYSELNKTSLLDIYKTVRKHIQKAAKENITWRAVIDSLRPNAQNIWIHLSAKDKQQFISHLRHIWGVVRHRLPVKTYEEMNLLKTSGQMEIIGGRIEDVQEQDGHISVSIILRKQSHFREINVGTVVNCTGPQTNYNELQDELVMNLLRKKMILSDPLKMGIQATINGEVLQNNREVSKDMYALGSMLRGLLWETTAVPDIRLQTEHIAKQIINSIT